MKLTNIFILGGLMAGMALTSSCDDQLSALPTQSKVDGNVVVDQKSAEAALNGIYYRFAQCTTDNYGVESTDCASTYESYPANIGGTIEFYQGPYMFETHGNSTYERYANYLWSPFYQQIAAINGVIDQVTKANDSWFVGNRKNEIIAEARCMRAIVNYNILRFFGYSWDIDSPYGNILRTQASSSKNLPCERSNVKDTYQAILDDLEYAIQESVDENKNYYASKWVAKGQKIRTLMMRGQGDDYATAAELAKDIIEHSPYSLEAHTTDIFHKLGLQSNVVMFGIKPQNKGGQQTAVMETYYYRGTAQWNYTQNFYNLFKEDPRRKELILEEEKETTVYDYDEQGNIIGDHKEKVIVTTVCKHFQPKNIVANEVEESQYMMRLTEIYLLRAEALARIGGESNLIAAKGLLKTVMEHAGITDFTALDAVENEHDFMQVYFHEYLKNLFCENGRELEIMYRMPKEIVYAFNPEFYSATYNGETLVSIDEPLFGKSILAIPSDEFKNNRALTKADQNPGYSIAN